MNKKITLRVGLLALFFFIALSFVVVRGNIYIWNDLIFEYVETLRTPILTNIMVFLDFFGSLYTYVFILVILFIIKKTRYRISLPVGAAVLASEALNHIIKFIFAIPRPNVDNLVRASGYGHPSGHSMNAMAFLGTLCIILVFNERRNSFNFGIIAISFFYVVIMGFSRVYLGVHTVTDVIAGYMLGIFIFSVNHYIWQLK